MSRKTHLRFLLPVVQTSAAILFGGIGLWQRHQILNQRFWGDQTLWQSTARFHVWPLPYRFAVICNIPAYLTAGVVEWPISTVWPHLPELFGFTLFVLLVPGLWYIVGARLDRMPEANNRGWFVLPSFAALSVAGIFTPGYIGYVFTGCLLWVAFSVTMRLCGHS